MAQKTHIVYVSDLSGKDITDNDSPTLAFGWDGSDYTIDLTAKEAEAFYSAMEKYLSVATKAGKSKAGKKAKSTSNAAEIRAWAKDNGHDVPDRGRIPADVRAVFEATN